MEPSEIKEVFSGLGPVTIKRMFGGKGVYYRGTIVGIEYDGELLLKADAVTAPEFEAAGAVRWVYDGRPGRTVSMPYWSIPATAFDNPDNMGKWVKLAYEAAVRSTKISSKR